MKSNSLRIPSYFVILLRRNIYFLLFFLDKLLQRESKLIILCYHSISSNGWRFSTPPQLFEKQIQYLKEMEYEFITLSDLYSYLNHPKKIHKKSLLINFDNVYEDIYG